MAEWRVVILEPDTEVARSHWRCLASLNGFVPVGVARSAEQALEMVATLRPHLLVMDVELPGENGLALLRRLRAAGSAVEAIVVTASGDARVVRAAMRLGAVDYLIKPHRPERLRQALGLFLLRAACAAPGTRLEQDDIDRLTAMRDSPRRWLPKDLDPQRLDQIRTAIETAGMPLTAEEVALRIGVARTTARRYLEYLVTVTEATVEQVPDGPGRPPKAYMALGHGQGADRHVRVA
jgi:response regulator of citrate/malate metabolism